jgi:pSer/pThr/pTyr-binding forkhead associated (FHA) protein
MPCPTCAHVPPAGATTCPHCGTLLKGSTLIMPHGSKGRPWFALRVVRTDGGREAVVEISGDALTCGKDADLKLPDDPFVSPVQARFFFSGDKLAVEDVGGGNGVFLRVRDEREIPPGGELRVGRQRLVAESIPPRTPGPGGIEQWGSPDPGHRFRMVQLLEGGIRASAFPLRDGTSLVGRETGDITFRGDGFVSGRHASLHVAGNRITVRDLGSSNGTFVRLAGPVLVDGGDQLLVGRQLLRVERGTEDTIRR